RLWQGWHGMASWHDIRAMSRRANPETLECGRLGLGWHGDDGAQAKTCSVDPIRQTTSSRPARVFWLVVPSLWAGCGAAFDVSRRSQRLRLTNHADVRVC